jgi:hypothetical protein
VPSADGYGEHAPLASCPSGIRLFGAVGAVVLSFCAICTFAVIELRDATGERAAEVASSLTIAIESDVLRNFETLDLSLQAVVDNLERQDID